MNCRASFSMANVTSLTILMQLSGFTDDIRRLLCRPSKRQQVAGDESVREEARASGSSKKPSAKEEAKIYFSQLEQMWA